MENLEVCMSSAHINQLKSVENRLHTRIQKQLMDENNPTNGSLFETIQQINQQMIDKINIKLDLRQEPIYQGDNEPGEDKKEEANETYQQK